MSKKKGQSNNKTYRIINPLNIPLLKYKVILNDYLFYLSLFIFTFFFGYLDLLLIKRTIFVLDIPSIVQGYGVNDAFHFLTSFYLLFIFYTSLYLLILSFIRCFLRIKTWSILFNKKFTEKDFFKYFMFNLIFLPIITFIFIYLFIYEFKYIQNDFNHIKNLLIYYFILFFVFYHYSTIYTINFLNTKKIVNSFKNTLKDMFNINLFLLPYFLFFIFSTILILVSKYINHFFIVFFIIIFSIFFLWMRDFVRLSYETIKE